MRRRELLLGLVVPITATAASSSFVHLTVKKTGLLRGKSHLFNFPDYHGKLAVPDSSDLSRQQVSFVVQTRTLICQDDWVNEKDRKKITSYALTDMLRSDRFPTLRYQSSSIKQNGTDQYSLEGILTIRDQSRPVPVAVIRHPGNPLDAWWSGSAVIRLNDFGLKPPSAALGAIGTENDMYLDFRLSSADFDISGR